MRVTPPSPPPVNSRPTPWPRSPNRRNRISRRTSMYRIILFLVLIALAAAGAVRVADQTGDVVLLSGGARITITQAGRALGGAVVAAMLLWAIWRLLWWMPERIRRRRRERRAARGRHAITQGLLAIGHGDSRAARAHADVARRHA